MVKNYPAIWKTRMANSPTPPPRPLVADSEPLVELIFIAALLFLTVAAIAFFVVDLTELGELIALFERPWLSAGP